MQKNEIINQLTHFHVQFGNYTNALTDAQKQFALPEKWTAGQQVLHIYKSVRPLALGLSLPKFVIKIIWGKANRTSKTYDQLVQKYNEKLTLGGIASKPFVPKYVAAKDVGFWNDKINTIVKRLHWNLKRFSEIDFDTIILPHPLLGKVTLREMMYFTIHHVQHHQKLIENALSKM